MRESPDVEVQLTDPTLRELAMGFGEVFTWYDPKAESSRLLGAPLCLFQ